MAETSPRQSQDHQRRESDHHKHTEGEGPVSSDGDVPQADAGGSPEHADGTEAVTGDMSAANESADVVEKANSSLGVSNTWP